MNSGRSWRSSSLLISSISKHTFFPPQGKPMFWPICLQAGRPNICILQGNGWQVAIPIVRMFIYGFLLLLFCLIYFEHFLPVLIACFWINGYVQNARIREQPFSCYSPTVMRHCWNRDMSRWVNSCSIRVAWQFSNCCWFDVGDLCRYIQWCWLMSKINIID